MIFVALNLIQLNRSSMPKVQKFSLERRKVMRFILFLKAIDYFLANTRNAPPSLTWKILLYLSCSSCLVFTGDRCLLIHIKYRQHDREFDAEGIYVTIRPKSIL